MEAALNTGTWTSASRTTVTENGSDLVIASDGASGNTETVCILSDSQARVAFPAGDLVSASKWLRATTDTVPVASATVGPVVLPKDVNT